MSKIASPLEDVVQPRHRGSQVSVGGVPEFPDEGMVLEDLLHDTALHAFSAAVNEPHLAEPCRMSGGHILLDDRCDVSWRERVQIQRGFHRQVMNHFDEYVAVTVVLMPPRTEKSPMTVIRRGSHAATRSSRIWFVTAS